MKHAAKKRRFITLTCFYRYAHTLLSGRSQREHEFTRCITTSSTSTFASCRKNIHRALVQLKLILHATIHRMLEDDVNHVHTKKLTSKQGAMHCPIKASLCDGTLRTIPGFAILKFSPRLVTAITFTFRAGDICRLSVI